MDLLKLYGLKRNPFGLGQPPQYKSEGWCFVDLKLEDGSYVSQRIESFIKKLSRGDPGRRGVLIIGHWGSGKTHILRQLLGRAGEEGLEAVEVSGVARSNIKKVDNLMKTLFGSADIHEVVEILSNEKRLVGIDEAQFFDGFAERAVDTFIELMENLRIIVEELNKNRSKAGIALCITPGPLSTLKDRRPDIPDRFDIIRLKEDLSEDEAIKLAASYLRTAREQEWENEIESTEVRNYVKSIIDDIRRNLWPFTIGAIRTILDFWNAKSIEIGIKKLRVFLDHCKDVLDYAARENANEILPRDAEECLVKHYDLWKDCLDLWKRSGIRKHKILVRGLYKAIDLARTSDADLKIETVFPELLLPVRSGSIRPDLVVKREGKFIIVEVETSRHVSTDRYERVHEAIKEGYASGVLVVCTNPSACLSARRVSFRVFKGENFDDILLETGDTLKAILTTGRLVAFAAADLENFPEDEEFRQEIRRVLSGSEAADALRLSKIQEKIRDLYYRTE